MSQILGKTSYRVFETKVKAKRLTVSKSEMIWKSLQYQSVRGNFRADDPGFSQVPGSCAVNALNDSE